MEREEEVGFLGVATGKVSQKQEIALTWLGIVLEYCVPFLLLSMFIGYPHLKG
jgi:hypothetical protein